LGEGAWGEVKMKKMIKGFMFVMTLAMMTAAAQASQGDPGLLTMNLPARWMDLFTLRVPSVGILVATMVGDCSRVYRDIEYYREPYILIQPGDRLMPTPNGEVRAYNLSATGTCEIKYW
jgi:hypothetical protein